jgi:hypothetical protein
MPKPKPKPRKTNNSNNEFVDKDSELNLAKSQPTKKRKKKKTDPAWSRKTGKTKKTNPSDFSTAGLLYLMQSAQSPAKKMVIFSDCKSPIKISQRTTLKTTTVIASASTQDYKLSTPDKGVKTATLESRSPNKSTFRKVRTLILSSGIVSLYFPSHKVVENDLIIPSQRAVGIQKSPVPNENMTGFFMVPLTKEIILTSEFAKQKRLELGQSARATDQNTLMNIPADEALKLAGIDAPKGTGQWVHFKSHCHFDESAQEVGNLGLGTRQANAAMELVNKVLRKLVCRKTTPQTLYLSYIPTWVPGYEDIRLLKTLEMRISDGQDHFASIEFNMLSRAKVCVSEIEPIATALMKEFDGNEERLQVQTALLPAADIVNPQSDELLSTQQPVSKRTRAAF